MQGLSGQPISKDLAQGGFGKVTGISASCGERARKAPRTKTMAIAVFGGD